MKYIQKILLVIVLILSLVFFISLVSAAEPGCCVYNIEGAKGSYPAACVDNGQPTSFGTLMTKEQCENGLGIWTDVACAEQTVREEGCEVGCCCDQVGGYVSTTAYACLGEDTWVPGNNCAQACTSSEKYTISGTVKDKEGNELSNVEVSMDSPEIIETTNPQGAFTFLEVPFGQRILTATTPECTKTINPYVIGDDDTLEIILDCATTTPEELCEPEWTCSFDGSSDTCDAYYDTCIATNCGADPLLWEEYYDGDPEPYKPLPYKACPEVTLNCNNNGVREGTEQCDGQDFPNDQATCEDFSTFIGTTPVTCTDCRIDTSACEICPTTSALGCTQTQCELCPGVCGDVCQENTCLEQKPTDVNIFFSEESDAIQLGWGFEASCSKEALSFTIESCTGNDCPSVCDDETCQEHIEASINLETIRNSNDFVKADGVYEYTGFAYEQDATNYCYRITAHLFQNGEAAITSTEGFICETSPSTICKDRIGKTFCGEEGNVMTCNEEGVPELQTQCGEQQACLASPLTNEAYCAEKNVCAECNGLFGMYSYLAYTSLAPEVYFNDDEWGENVLVSCADQRIFGPGSDGVTACYQGASLTVEDELTSCSPITSCYDYTTQNSCEQDDCNKGLACGWNPLSEELGIGVCVPQDNEAPQECGRCSDDTHLLPGCTQATCTLYATTENGCFYKETDTSCLTKEETTCSDYVTQEQCENGQTYEMDVTYGAGKETIGGTHTKLSESQDYFSFGVCQWVAEESRCIKNADNYTTLSKLSDCTGSILENYPNCPYDFEAPNTSLNIINATLQPWGLPYPVYSAKNLFDYTVTDNLFAKKDITTHFSSVQLPLSIDTQEETYTCELLQDICAPQQGESECQAINNIYGEEICIMLNTCQPVQDISKQTCQQLAIEGITQYSEEINTIDMNLQTFTCEPILGETPCSSNYDGNKEACLEVNQDYGAFICAYENNLCNQATSFNPNTNKALCEALDKDGYYTYIEKEQDLTNLEKPYPMQSYDDLKATLTQTESGNYLISYYSKDDSGNFEIIKEQTIGLDVDAPNITSIQNFTQAFKIDEDSFRTNLTIQYTVEDEHGPITCDAKLVKTEQTEETTSFPGDRKHFGIASGTQLVNTYHYLQDDAYHFYLNCTDYPFLGNNETYSYIFYAEADTSIKNPKPRLTSEGLEVFNLKEANSIQLSIETGLNATACYFGETKKPIEEGTLFENPSEDNTHFTYTLSTTEEKVHEYFTGCIFENGNITQGNPSDKITFGVDASTPITMITTSDGNLYEPQYYTDETSLLFKVTNQNENLIQRDKDGNILSNGNDNEVTTYYCLSDNANPLLCDFIPWTNEPINIHYTDQTPYIHYYSIDGKGNKEDIQTQFVYVRDLNLYITGVRICTIAGCISYTTPS